MRMPMMRALLLCALGGALGAAPASPGGFGGSVNVYAGSGGVRVITPSVHGDAELDPRTYLAVKADLDAVSAASFNYARSKTHRDGRPVGTCWTCHPPTDALSGATRNYVEVRRGVEVAVRRIQGPVELSATYLGNQENDYASHGASLGALYASESANTTLGLGLSALFDSISPVTRSFNDELRTLGVDLSLTQVLGPRTLGLLSWSMALAEGYHGSPYSFIQVGLNDTAPMRASHPRDKARQTSRLTLRQGLWTGASLEGDLRHYQDSWAVRSLTYAVSLAQRLGAWVLEPQLRFQDQAEGAAFFRNRYDSVQQHMSRDLKLARHQSLGYGVGLRSDLGAWSLESRWLRYQRQDDLDYSLYFADRPEQGDVFQVAVTLR
jgi:hypothetical protein